MSTKRAMDGYVKINLVVTPKQARWLKGRDNQSAWVRTAITRAMTEEKAAKESA